MSSTQTMKIYSIISKMEAELEDSPQTKLGGTGSRIVNIEAVFDLLSDLKMTIPEDIRRATSIIQNAETTIRDARDNAAEIIEAAKQEAESIIDQAQTSAEEIYQRAQEEFEIRVSESEILNEASIRAGEIMNEAETNANAIYNGAKNYADGILADLQRYIGEYHAMISANRKELCVAQEDEIPEQPYTEEERVFDDPYPVENVSNEQDGYYEEEYYQDDYPEQQYDEEMFEEEEPVKEKGGFLSKLPFKTKEPKKDKMPKGDDDKTKKTGFLSKLIKVEYEDDDEEEEE